MHGRGWKPNSKFKVRVISVGHWSIVKFRTTQFVLLFRYDFTCGHDPIWETVTKCSLLFVKTSLLATFEHNE